LPFRFVFFFFFLLLATELRAIRADIVG